MSPNRLVNFEPKVGWSGIIALVALMVATIALLQGRSAQTPDLELMALDVGHGIVQDLDSDWKRLLMVQPVFISNRGGRAVTLVGLEPAEGLPLVVGLKEGQSEPVNLRFDVRLTGPFDYSWITEPQLVLRKQAVDKERMTVLNKVVGPGESELLHVGVLFEAYDGLARRADVLALAFDALFSDGSRQTFRSAMPVPSIGGRSR